MQLESPSKYTEISVDNNKVCRIDDKIAIKHRALHQAGLYFTEKT